MAERTPLETGLPEGRVRNETGRTCNQLRMFADLVADGSWVDARIDQADPGRSPLPKPGTRSMWVPLGPVVVFGASNFPLAFSVAGGDTASALAAGNPVIVKAHPAHPGTSEIVAEAVAAAVSSCDMPDGVFSLLYGVGNELGATLVAHPAVRAVGFTGSTTGGRALMDIAAARPEPIPVYAEMGSQNPVFLLPKAIATRGDAIAKGLVGSLNLGVGQFCTNPGLVFALAGADTDRLVDDVAKQLQDVPAAAMLTRNIADAYRSGADKVESTGLDTVVAPQPGEAGPGGAHAAPGLFRTDVATFLERPELRHELFGPAAVVCIAESPEQLVAAAARLEGQLTATIHADADEWPGHAELVTELSARVGRLIANGFPTGVEVCSSMVHGGPYPASSAAGSTSVGTRAIYRFCRQLCYQDLPDAALPPELRDENPLGLWRLVDGKVTRDALGS
ncbi:MAG: aldehyde dehydrogenase (NADP(+)) [Myxococcales bacterium FL481]|nr:MAG: aldehyde dehydrogenase (NADP(+)) [Myxococcales bacterium FL481]